MSSAWHRIFNYVHGQTYSIDEIERDQLACICESNESRTKRGWDLIPEEPHHRWVEFKAKMQEGDHIEWFANIQGERSGQMGWVIVREGYNAAFYLVALA